ncbi:hypothetical protein [Sphingobacterium bambusae]|uniref:DUF3822 domain-containing protein n=1 Tax=Sphingobacterium bambusae TaxID=662858 RepID=A0ABW6BFD1_9SPHI|nr:hypothetical protein [Sphingobacterium bambusae]WPL48819.1 hypothetical protein SCB77_22975 [Sphingobacterium bambusae]
MTTFAADTLPVVVDRKKRNIGVVPDTRRADTSFAVVMGASSDTYTQINNDFVHSDMVYISTSVSNSLVERGRADTDFINYLSDFEVKYRDLSEENDMVPYDFAKGCLVNSLDFLLKMEPEKLSVRPTYDNTIFYTFIKANVTAYISHFLIQEDDDDDELAFSAFHNGEKLPSFAGDFSSFTQAFVDTYH